MEQLKVIIIDDERLARQELKHMLENHKNEIEIIGEASNGKEAIKMIESLNPDLIFLDIQMPEMDGFEVINRLEEIPKVIFVTAYDNYALEAFKVGATDYLLKPIEADALKKAIEKLSTNSEDDFFSPTESERSNRKLTIDDHIFIKDGEKCYFPKLSEVRYFESQGNYVKIFFNDHHPMILRSLNALQDRLSTEDFFRANRKYLVNFHHIQNIENWFNGGLKLTFSDKVEIEISRRQTIRFKEMMTL
ncbi:LytR/AlgR family response regulator transcription factor [Brumimicrobium aurantiacum]|uniref:DNA-binding response regulator n=1 Tax=Brumimicrobium aurantiacum TaxID=1737063 RepID=A0A3E1EZX2_9FLAO|nr:LytTR family DNA-binding domain-containing protein [Brumimicrobium aurantiacum]RFC55106.1 DNA-binding response regulator [Brumimicrobium aurantiacum]